MQRAAGHARSGHPWDAPQRRSLLNRAVPFASTARRGKSAAVGTRSRLSSATCRFVSLRAHARDVNRVRRPQFAASMDVARPRRTHVATRSARCVTIHCRTTRVAVLFPTSLVFNRLFRGSTVPRFHSVLFIAFISSRRQVPFLARRATATRSSGTAAARPAAAGAATRAGSQRRPSPPRTVLHQEQRPVSRGRARSPPPAARQAAATADVQPRVRREAGRCAGSAR